MTTDALHDLLSPAQRAALRAPIGQAATFPRHAYTSQAFYDLEVDRIFSRTWSALCFGFQLAQPGDVAPFDELGCPLFAARGPDGRLRVFHNVGPYDGCPVVMEPAQAVTSLRVAYHGWEYSLHGTLLAAPLWGGSHESPIEAVPATRRNLVEVPSVEWMGVLFVDLSGCAGPFETLAQAMAETLVGYDLDGLVPARDAQGATHIDHGPAVSTNWKTFVENDCLNVLHESFVHQLYRRSAHVPRIDADDVATFRVEAHGPVLGFSYADAAVGDTYPEPDLPPIAAAGAPPPGRGHFLQLFPNLSLMVRHNYVSLLILHPRGPGSVRIATSMLVHRSAPLGSLSALGDVHRMLDEAGREDARVIEAVQSARRSPVSGEHPYSPFWDEPHHRFNQMVLDHLELRHPIDQVSDGRL